MTGDPPSPARVSPEGDPAHDTVPAAPPAAVPPLDRASPPLVPDASVRVPGRRLAGSGPPWLAAIIDRRRIDLLWLGVIGCMLAAAAVFFGFRALLCVAITTGSALVAAGLVGLLIQLFRPQRRLDSYLHALALALLLGLSLPITLDLTVPALAGLLLGILFHLTGRTHRVRLHPVAVVLLLVWLMPGLLSGDLASARQAILPPVDAVLKPKRVLVGDLARVSTRTAGPWWRAAELDPGRADATRRLPPGPLVLAERQRILEHPLLLPQMLTSGELCRLEELLLGCVPGSLGASSRGLLLVLGMYLAYRRQAWWPMYAAAFLAAVATLLVMPMENGLVAAGLRACPAPVAVTYLAYMFLAPPFALVILILAPLSAPIGGTGRLIYGVLVGAGATLALWFIAEPSAAFLTLVPASLLSPWLDGLQRSPFVGGEPLAVSR